ncbi:MAG: hypothetical protein WEB89_06280 [Balneolales bacterium]
MSKKTAYFISPLLTVILFMGVQSDALAQFKADQPSTFDRTGSVTKETRPIGDEKVLGLFNFQMDHSYEMSMSSMGGNTYNQNFYTNTMHFLFNEDFYGRVDVGLAHSPFGNSMMGNNQGLMGNDQAQVVIRNAELNYKLNENTRFRVSFQQQPVRYGYGYGYHNGFGQRSYRDRHNSFYSGW